MQIDKNYIEMCFKARELQDVWQVRIGDLYINQRWLAHYENTDECRKKMNQDIRVVQTTVGETPDRNFFIKDNYTWLPRVDELYELSRKINGSVYFPVSMMELICKTWRENQHTVFRLNYNQSDSLEQIWLAFWMLTQHDKAWDDKLRDWVDAAPLIELRTKELKEKEKERKRKTKKGIFSWSDCLEDFSEFLRRN